MSTEGKVWPSGTQMPIFRETVAKFPQDLGQVCTLLPHRDRSLCGPGSISPPLLVTVATKSLVPLAGVRPPHLTHRPVGPIRCEVPLPEAEVP